MWRAVLASNSPVGLFPPVLHQGDLLVDGAILENVPVRAMRSASGHAPGAAPRQWHHHRHRRGRAGTTWAWTRPAAAVGLAQDLRLLPVQYAALAGHRRHPYRAGHIGGLNQRARTIAQSDHYLEPPVAAFSAHIYRQAVEIAEVGYRYAMKEIERWGPDAPEPGLRGARTTPVPSASRKSGSTRPPGPAARTRDRWRRLPGQPCSTSRCATGAARTGVAPRWPAPGAAGVGRAAAAADLRSATLPVVMVPTGPSRCRPRCRAGGMRRPGCLSCSMAAALAFRGAALPRAPARPGHAVPPH